MRRNDADYRKQFPLHALIRDVVEGFREDDTWMDEVRAALDAEFDPNEKDEEGASPFDYLDEEMSGGTPTAFLTPMIRLMVRKGANPLANRESLVVNMFQKAYTGSSFELVGLAMLRGLSEAETEDDLIHLSFWGGNALHELGKQVPQIVADVLEHDHWLAGLSTLNLPRRWFNERDQDGNTPLMSMWNEQSTLSTKLKVGLDMSEYQSAWESASMMVAGGADLKMRDNQGFSAAWHIAACADRGFRPASAEGDDLLAQCRALIEQDLLEEGTPSVAAATRKPGRL